MKKSNNSFNTSYLRDFLIYLFWFTVPVIIVLLCVAYYKSDIRNDVDEDCSVSGRYDQNQNCTTNDRTYEDNMTTDYQDTVDGINQSITP